MAAARKTRGRRITSLLIIVVLVIGLAAVFWPSNEPEPVATEDVTVPVTGGEGEDPMIDIDATVYFPTSLPAPAIIMAHGLGGSKRSVTSDAQDLARAGYLVLAYSARGFGASGGHIHLDSLDYEVQDAKQLVDYLGTRSDVVQDAANDPRVGVTGGSYGGAVSLMLAGIDPRVDTAVPMITWHSLADALFPNYASSGEEAAAGTVGEVAPATDGVFKRYWAAVFMTSITSGSLASSAASLGITGNATESEDGEAPAEDATNGAPATAPDLGSMNPMDLLAEGSCGRVALDICAGYTRVAESGRLDQEMADLLAKSSPAAVVGDITAPTLLVQGERDTLFGLDHADANARAIAANGTDVSVIWFSGGHDGGGIDDTTRAAVHSWFDHYLAQDGPAPALGFRYSIDGSISDTGRARSRILSATDGYPGLAGVASAPTTPVTLAGSTQPILSPPGGTPAGISSLPGLGSTASTALATLGGEVPGQAARFSSDPLTSQILLTGSAKVNLSITAGPSLDSLATGDLAGGTPDEATLFVKLYKVSASGVRTLAGGAASPIRVTGLTVGQAVEVPVSITPVALQVDAGSSIQIVVATTDQAFAVQNQAATYLVSLTDDPTLTVPVAGGSNISTSEIPVAQLIGLIILLVLGAIALVLAGIVRKHRADIDPELVDLPLRITGLRKEYPGGVTAVTDVGFEVKAGQVLGLLGPNGAGKTTSLRMVMGLINPSAGEIRVFGHKVTPGAPVLSRIGSFVEGSGFLPHLSGKDNLNLYWQATGRPAEAAYMEQALEIAGLGKAVNRRVRTYSQGMRQRLAIAQAMLGLPDLLILDEPTNGLDPPQIHAMREVLRRYAATGRTVLVSSHLLSEVEQTCTHVVVVHQGKTIAAGTVAELVAASGEMTFVVDDPERAAGILSSLPGITEVDVEDGQVQIDLAGTSPADAIAALVDAGIAIKSAAPRNRLEDVFLDLVGATGPTGGKS